MNNSIFADKLAGMVRHVGTPLCVGLDPHLDKIPYIFQKYNSIYPKTHHNGVRQFLFCIMKRLEKKVAVVKINSAFFEQMGYYGHVALGDFLQDAKKLGFLTILDVKRGDIGSTAQAYAEAYLKKGAYLEADAITVCPYVGLECVLPFANECYKNGKGLFVLVKTSNQNFSVQNLVSDGKPVYWHIAKSLAPFSEQLIGSTGWSSLGVVCGANYSDSAKAIREVLPNAIFLAPGYGHQGGSAEDAVASFDPASQGMFKGGIVSSSRSIIFPEGDQDVENEEQWNKLIDASVDAAIADINKATRLVK